MPSAGNSSLSGLETSIGGFYESHPRQTAGVDLRQPCSVATFGDFEPEHLGLTVDAVVDPSGELVEAASPNVSGVYPENRFIEARLTQEVRSPDEKRPAVAPSPDGWAHVQGIYLAFLSVGIAVGGSHQDEADHPIGVIDADQTGRSVSRRSFERLRPEAGAFLHGVTRQVLLGHEAVLVSLAPRFHVHPAQVGGVLGSGRPQTHDASDEAGEVLALLAHPKDESGVGCQ